ncbi:MAG: transglycosylase SLT domain-containing protein [Bacteroidales bacterium]|nr:transglycosylase SLT domain-containing protein [Bacteroidales bacterium]MCM1147436.1 transglycosylase SLT domain-containing protein [Bacteroidales bacterium]MCM1206105.1 transglycosylase SLT domain-containing protein [Bacillota bacterium]MCM1510064.1 transglycosylase SLT domain-containing protein [Clostridium sp.]
MDSEKDSAGTLSLDDIVTQGELIAFALNGPDTYYEYRGHGMGLHYLLAEQYAQKIGVRLRVEVCRDSTELIRKLANGDGDLVIVPKSILADDSGIYLCGPKWLTNNKEIAAGIKQWYTADMMVETEKMQKSLLAAGSVTRHVYQPMLDRQNGIISRWDGLFRKHASAARLDWRLVAAQCYQESCFDPRARSWAGACGLMQIMPSTAQQLGLPISEIYSPEQNISAAMLYMKRLMEEFRDIPRNGERICFALAAYNGGKHHIRDAMALARKHGKDPHRWDCVKEFIVKLTTPQFYTDPVVKYGYMRGTETADYVTKIMQRYDGYRGQAHSSVADITPQRAVKHHKYKPQE